MKGDIGWNLNILGVNQDPDKIFVNIDFRKNLTQFYINISRREHQIELLWVSINSYNAYTPFHCSFTAPL